MTLWTLTPYARPPLPAIPYPRFGVGILPSNPNNNDYVNLLTNVLTTSISGSTFSLNDGGTQYMYFASPAIHGNLTFTDTVINIVGGWDGANWPTDNTYLETGGRKEIQLTIGGDTRTWYLYRTDFKGIGLRTFRINFDVPPVNTVQPTDPLPGVGFGDLTTAFANFIDIAVNAAPYVARMEGGQYLAFRYSPHFGMNHIHNVIGTGDVNVRLYDKNFQPMTNLQNLNNGPNGGDEINYVYDTEGVYAFLVVQDLDAPGNVDNFNVNITSQNVVISGTGYNTASTAIVNATPIEPNVIYKATLNDGKFAAYSFTPAIGREYSFRAVSSNGTNEDVMYYLHNGTTTVIPVINSNTDGFGETSMTYISGSGATLYMVVRIDSTGVGSGELDISVNYSTLPPKSRYGVGNLAPGFNGSQLLDVITTPVDAVENNSSFTLTSGAGEYMYFATPVSHGLVTFTDSLGFAGGWDGATWPNDGNIGTTDGPVVLNIAHNGDTSDWYVYRTDFPQLGTQTFKVRYAGVI